MKKLSIILIFFLALINQAAGQNYTYSNGDVIHSGEQDAVRMRSSGSSINGYIYLPKGYDSSESKRYALICYYHGAGGNGDAGNAVSDPGLANLISSGTIPYSSITPGDTTWFIVYTVAGDFMGVSSSYAQIPIDYRFLLDYYKLKIDTTRVYATGLSAGGNQTLVALVEDSTIFAAGVPMSTVWSNMPAGEETILQTTAPGWLMQVHGYNDNTAIFSLAHSAIQTYNTNRPGHQAILWTYNGGHSDWNTYYNPSTKWTSNNANDIGTFTGTNIYTWLLQYSLGPSANVPPTANAGPDQILSSGTTSTNLDGTGSADPDGTIVSYHWTKVGTNGATIVSPSSAITSITGLADGNTYNFQLTVTDDSSATGSDQVSITVNSASLPDDTPIYKIPISSTGKMYSGDTVFYQMNDLTASGIADSLLDEQDADPLHGINTPIPHTKFWAGNNSSTNIYYPTIAVIDFGGIYKVTNEYYYKNLPSAIMCVVSGEPGNWNTDTMKTTIGGTGWFDLGDTVRTRYLKVFYLPGGNQNIYGFIPYGHLEGSDSLSRTRTGYSPDNAYNTMGDFMGINIYGSVPFNVRDSLGGIFRQYNNQSYLDTVTMIHNVDDILFSFSKFSSTASPFAYHFPDENSTIQNWRSLQSDSYGMGIDQKHYDSTGQTLFYATQGVNQYNLNVGIARSIDPVEHPDMDSSKASSYDRLARMAWNIGAIFGRNSYPTDSIQATIPIGTSGLGVMKYVETGNENNGSWLTKTQYYSPETWVAYNSAYYDGNNGTMGTRCGVKQADDSVKVVMGGDASSVRMDYMKAMRYWSYYKRTNHSIPFDIYNFHDYAYIKPGPAGAVSPENYNLRTYLQGIVDSAHDFCPRCKVWETEWGYDRNRKSPLGVAIIAGKDSAQIQADWEARYWLISSFVRGLKRSTVFQIRNDPLPTKFDSLGAGTFNTSGLTDGHQTGTEFNYYAFPAYYFQRTIWSKLHDYRPDSIIYENHDSIWVYQYRNTVHPDSVIYAVWSGTKTNRGTDSFAIKTGHPNVGADVLLLQDKEMMGAISNHTADENGEIPLVINETPLFIMTTSGTGGGTLVQSSGPAPPTVVKKALLYLTRDGKIVIINSTQ